MTERRSCKHIVNLSGVNGSQADGQHMGPTNCSCKPAFRPVYAEDFPEMSPPLESVDCILQFFGEGPQFAVVEENTCNICIESSDFDCVADFSALKNVIQCFERI